MDQKAIAMPGAGAGDEISTQAPKPFRAGLSLPILGLVFPPTGIVAVIFALRSRGAAHDRKLMLRYAMQSRLWAQYSFGIGFALLVIAAVASAFVVNNFAVADSYFDLEILVAGFPQIARAFVSNLWVSVIAEITA